MESTTDITNTTTPNGNGTNSYWAVVTVMGQHLVKVRAIHQEQAMAEEDKKNYPHVFGTHVYPCKQTTRVGHEMSRNHTLEAAP